MSSLANLEDFMDELLHDGDGNNAYLGNDVSSQSFLHDYLLAQKLQETFEREDAELVQAEKRDFELARRLAQEEQGEGEEHDGNYAWKRSESAEMRDFLLAQKLQQEEEALLSEDKNADAFTGFQMSHQSRDGDDYEEGDLPLIRSESMGERASLRLAMELSGMGDSNDAELAARLQAEWEAEEKALELQDLELAKRLMEEEEQEAAKRAKIDHASEEIASSMAKPVLPGAKVEDIISQHLEFLAGSDLTLLRKFCKHNASLSMRPILRPDLEARFRQKAAEYSQSLGLDFAAAVVAFHGTAQRHVDSIAQSGLIVPGTTKKVAISHGAAFGIGIYTSPDPDYALKYSRDGKILCVAVLLGRTKRVEGSEAMNRKTPLPGVDSHIARGDKEFVVFDPACVLPLFLIDLNRGGVPSAPTAWPLPASGRRAARKSVSRKKR